MENRRQLRAMFFFFGVATSIWLVFHAIVGRVLFGPLELSGWASAVAWSALMGLGLLVPINFAWSRDARPGEGLRDRFRRVAQLYMAFFSMVLGLSLLKAVLELGLAAVGVGVSRGELAVGPTLAVVAGALAMTVAGNRAVRRGATLRRVEIALPRLPESFDGFRIVQISDMHLGNPSDEDDFRRIVAMTNDVRPDIVAITGDLLDGRPRDVVPMLRPMRELKAKHGVYYVTGNHEYYHGDVQAFIDGVADAGAIVLNDDFRIIEASEHRLAVCGVADIGAPQFRDDHRSDPARAAAGVPDDAFRLLLAHQPRSAIAAAAVGFDLMLAGHTHGGQFWPWTWIIGWFHPVAVGLGRVEGMPVYVSRGTGTWGPPVRLGAPAELTEIVLRPA